MRYTQHSAARLIIIVEFFDRLINMITTSIQEYAGIQSKAALRTDVTAPILYMVHGRAGTHDVMWAFRRTAPETFSLVAPQASVPDPIGGFSWWQVVPQPDPIDVSLARSETLLSFCREFEKSNSLNPTVRLAIGFSQGAALLSLAMQKAPAYFHGVGLLAGFVLEHPEKIASPDPLTEAEVFMAHGSEDEVVPIERARSGYRLLSGSGVEVVFYKDPVGHKVGTTGMRAMKEWLHSFD